MSSPPRTPFASVSTEDTSYRRGEANLIVTEQGEVRACDDRNGNVEPEAPQTVEHLRDFVRSLRE